MSNDYEKHVADRDEGVIIAIDAETVKPCTYIGTSDWIVTTEGLAVITAIKDRHNIVVQLLSNPAES